MAKYDARWQVLEDSGIIVKHLRALVEELHDSFRADEAGFKALSRIPDEILCAVVSDQICQSAYAIGENPSNSILPATRLSPKYFMAE